VDPDIGHAHAHDPRHVVDFDLSGEGFTERKIITVASRDRWRVLIHELNPT
jgi:hypothetical protein